MQKRLWKSCSLSWESAFLLERKDWQHLSLLGFIFYAGFWTGDFLGELFLKMGKKGRANSLPTHDQSLEQRQPTWSEREIKDRIYCLMFYQTQHSVVEKHSAL